MFIGVLLVILGVVFLGENMGWLPGGAWQIIWPLLLVALGISMMFKRSGHGCMCCGGRGKEDNK